LFWKVLNSSFFSFGVIFLFCGIVHGGYITINTTTDLKYEGSNLEVSIEVSNTGDESAYNVQFTCEILGKVLTSDIKPELKVQEAFKQVLISPLKLETPGRYPAVVTVSYTDGNQYPFSALSIPAFVYQEATSSKVLGILKGQEISSKGYTELIVKNLDDIPKTVRMLFVLPKELSSSDLQREINLDPKAEETIPLEVKNFSALPGSQYTVYAVLEYDLGEKHFNLNAVGNIKIVKKDLLKENKNILIGIAIFLALVFVALNIKFLKGRRKP